MPDGREVIRSRQNLFVRRLQRLIRRGREEGLVIVEGVRLAEEALAARLSLVEAAATPEITRHERGRVLVEEIASHPRVPLRWLDPSVMASLSDVETSQGVLLVARRPDQKASLVSGERPLLLVLAGVQDPGNLGGLLRTAEAAGVTGVFVGEGCADPFSPRALRGGMGSTFRLPVGFRTVATEVQTLRRAGISVWAAAADGKPFDQIDWRQPAALIVGNEGAGLPVSLVKACSGTVSVPMAGRVESLNVGVAAGVILFEAARQRRAPR